MNMDIRIIRPSRRAVLAGATAAFTFPARASGPGTHAAADALRRFIGKRAEAFDFHIRQARKPFFSVEAEQSRIRITSNSPVGLIRGAYAYLTAIGAAQANWEGDRIALPSAWPKISIAEATTPYCHRSYLNPCTYGYTMPFWDWTRWSREIDWMALHGIDMPLAMEGQEYVWRALWREAGLSDTELAAYFSGPAFLPWQRMGNIEGYATPLPSGWIEKKHRLQTRILKRMRALEMTPILPAFAGYVPKAFAQKHPEARIHRMEPWSGFRETYWLDPLDPLFAPLAKRYLALYADTYGAGTHYLADSFNEMRPPIDRNGDAKLREDRLAAYGRALHGAIDAVTPGAVFVMQGWLFGIDAEFWTPENVRALLRDVPDDKALVLDIVNDSYRGTWERNRAYAGKGWIFGYIHDFGGNNPMFGDFDEYHRDMSALSQRTDIGNLQGFGVFPEGLNTNPAVYEYLYEHAWPGFPENLSPDDWFPTYLRARYGHTDAGLISAWAELRREVYHTDNWRSAWWKGAFGTYLFSKRPSRGLAGFTGEPLDTARLKKSVSDLLGGARDYGDAPLFRYDLIAACGHLVSLEIDKRLIAMLAALEHGDIPSADALWRTVDSVTRTLDAILGAQPQTLASWIAEAERYGDTAAEKACYAENARTQVTIWGGDGNLNDYASKTWQGLYGEYYLPRWEKLYRALRASAENRTPFDDKAFADALTDWERHWAQTYRPKICRVPKNLYAEIGTLLASV